jgi:thymidylate synthase
VSARPIDGEWADLLDDILTNGERSSPRGLATRELRQRTVRVDATRPVLLNQARKLSYRFMAAEAYWILSGDDTVAGIAPWNENIRQFSDDGVTFFGAYGPRIVASLGYVVDTLARDPASRQAGFTLWRPDPPFTKDVPCTVALFFRNREVLGPAPPELGGPPGMKVGWTELDVHAFMRSSDAWLGLPYDAFTFCAVGWSVIAELSARDPGATIRPGSLYLTAASSHLYESDVERTREALLARPRLIDVERAAAPPELWASTENLTASLKRLRDSRRGDAERWWEKR